MNTTDESGATGPAATSLLLWDLLASDPGYRARWLLRCDRAPAARRDDTEGTVSFAAISKVISDWVLLHEPDTMGDLLDMGDYRSIRDRVRRALTGAGLQPGTLGWFIESFDMTQADARRLADTFSGLGEQRSGSLPERWLTLPASGHRTLSLHERHVIGADRLPVRHHTMQVIESEIAELRMYPFRFDTPDAVVVVEQGGTAGPVYQEQDDLWCSNLELAPPLRLGHTAAINYTSRFFYRAAPPPEFRRGARRRIEAVSLTVAFHPDAVPRQVRWGCWDATGVLVESENVELADLVAHRFLRNLEDAIVGFTWNW